MQKYHLENRPDREIKDKSEIAGILNNGKFCTISMCRDNEPYIVTLSYGYDLDNDALYFHCSDKVLKHLEKKPEIKQEKLVASEGFYSKMKVLRLEITEIHGKAGR